MPLLHKGQRFQMGGVRYRVAYVNFSRAHCVATVKTPVTVRDRKSGEARTFEAKRQLAIDISPNSCVELLPELEATR